MITTRESINFQFSLIFGYSSPTELITGDVIGPGKLTKEMVNDLSKEVITYLRMYNAILRDFAGSEVFSIEFELYNFDQKDAQMNIYPKSMILIPGKYKDCESLLLALKPETGYLDPHKSRESINHISKLFSEVEEFSNHPSLEQQKKIQLYNKFATRFSKKLYGDLIEDKWNKKLIGLNVSLPTEKDMLSIYATIMTDVAYLWNKNPIEMLFSNHKYERLKSPYIGKSTTDHLKYAISEPSANFIVEKTLILGNNLLKLANTGTIDEIQEKIISFFITKIEENLGLNQNLVSSVEFISLIEILLTDFDLKVDNFLQISMRFLTTGESGNILELLEKYELFIINNSEDNIDFDRDLCKLAMNSITLSINNEEKLRAIELSSVMNYFAEVIKSSIKYIKNSLPRFLSRRRLNTLTYRFIRILHAKFENEQKPSKILGQSILDKFKRYLISQIEINPIVTLKNGNFNEESVIREFKKLVNNNVKSFFSSINLNISDLIAFAEVQMEKDSKLIEVYVKKFEHFSNELKYLLSYILKYTTINRFLKEEPDGEISDPVTFANRFHRFLEKRIGAISLTWKTYMLEWIKDYAKKFLNVEEMRDWSLDETLFNFVTYLEERESNEQKPETFFKFLDKYILQISNETEKEILIDFYKHYEFCIGIKTEFPKYVQNKIEKEINLFNIDQEKVVPLKYLSVDDQNSFYDYITEKELKYFSKLIPRPVSLILKQELTPEEIELFSADLFHVFEFKYWHKKAKYDIADNFKEVYREWIKKL